MYSKLQIAWRRQEYYLFVDKVGIFVIEFCMILWIMLLSIDKITDFLAVSFRDVVQDNWFQSGVLFFTLYNTHHELNNKTYIW